MSASLQAEVQQPSERRRYQRLKDLARTWGRHTSSFTRDILKGHAVKRDGEVVEVIRLEAVRGPGQWLVPEGAYEHYLERLTAARLGEPAPASPSATAARQRRLARVDSELESIGI